MSFNFDALHNFTGAQQWFRHYLIKDVLYTEGVKYVADSAVAYWLLDEMAFFQSIKKVAAEAFQVWSLAVKNNQATLTCDDGNNNVVLSKTIAFTDFPEPGIQFYAEYGGGHCTIMLPSER
jgi:hypothetical protein